MAVEDKIETELTFHIQEKCAVTIRFHKCTTRDTISDVGGWTCIEIEMSLALFESSKDEIILKSRNEITPGSQSGRNVETERDLDELVRGDAVLIEGTLVKECELTTHCTWLGEGCKA